MKKLLVIAVMPLLAALALPRAALSQSDPGVRGGPINGQPGATQGSPLPLASVNANSPSGILEFFDNGLGRFQEVEVVSGGVNNGLGPRFNLNSCSGCHAQPAVGGSSPPSNPEFQVIAQGIASGSTNTLPSFITPHGPTLVARFPFFTNSNGGPNRSAPNGGVEDFFTVSGRSDAGNCNLQQPNFQQALQTNNIIFRIPTPTFGAGLIENIDDSTLIANQQAQAANNLGIGGAFNRNGNDGTIARFGWKAQNKSLLMFAGEAYNVEMGVSNQLFPQERDETAACRTYPSAPEDTNNMPLTITGNAMTVLSDIEAFANFMRLLAPPVPAASNASTISGRAAFASTGCALCHTPSFSTGHAISSGSSYNPSPALSNQAVNLFSDLLVHHTGQGLADGITQAAAGPDEFRTAPLWGLGQRVYFLHHGRANDLLAAIQAHESQGSEADGVIQRFNNLSAQHQQNILNFLRSL
jgi:CxxC motif-containing protein (DUF1111 family)